MSAMDKVKFALPVEEIEGEAYAQIGRTSSVPWVKQMAVMPDVHYGKGSTVGTVVLTKGALMPSCVGVDIGCGMISVRTSVSPESLADPAVRKALREEIEKVVPVGIGGFGMNDALTSSAKARVNELRDLEAILGRKASYFRTYGADWEMALGSLGGGNHFIEVCLGSPCEKYDNPGSYPDEVWVTLHSGSRGVGNKLAQKHIAAAKEWSKDWGVSLPDPDLAMLRQGTAQFDQYLGDLQWAQKFALLNREEMMDRVLRVLYETTNHRSTHELERINCHHNYTDSYYTGDGVRYFLTRKGAVDASCDKLAMIPGSMGARSYIVRGLGNAEFLHSAPHGAGRRMSRRKAKDQFTTEDVASAMTGIEARVRDSIRDEHPNAYKDIEQVMLYVQDNDLAVPEYVLRQIINVKGD